MADLVTLAECPPGPFRFGDTLGFKTEYGAMETVGPTNVPGPEIRWTVGNRPDAYCMDSGEYFWGGAKTPEERDALMVEPVDLSGLLSALRQRDEALDWLAGRTNLELDYSYGDEDEEGRGWRIHRVSGNRSDREWELIATAETPAKAIEQARAILTGSETK